MTNLVRYILLWNVLIFTSLSAFAQQTTPDNHYPLKKILLVLAADEEAGPIISALNLHKIPSAFPQLPMQGYAGKYEQLDIFLITNGIDPIHKVQNVGTQAATLATYLGVNYFHPDLIISIGTAGGVEQNGAKQKDIYFSRKIYFYDRRLTSKGYHEYALGGYPSADFSAISKKSGLKPGIVCSGDSFDDSQTDYKIFIKQQCTAIDMEAAGVAWVSMLTKTPMIAIKGVTNFVKGSHIQEQYRKNLPGVMKKMTEKLKEFLMYTSQADKNIRAS